MAHCRIVIVGAALAAIASHFIAPPIAAKAAPTKVASPAIGAAWHLIIPPQFESHPSEVAVARLEAIKDTVADWGLAVKGEEPFRIDPLR